MRSDTEISSNTAFTLIDFHKICQISAVPFLIKKVMSPPTKIST